MGFTWLEVNLWCGCWHYRSQQSWWSQGGKFPFFKVGVCIWSHELPSLHGFVFSLTREWPSVRAEEAHHVPTLEQHFWCPHQQRPGHAHRGQGQKCWNGLRDHSGAQGAGREVQKEQWEDRDMGEHHCRVLQNVLGSCCRVRGCPCVPARLWLSPAAQE